MDTIARAVLTITAVCIALGGLYDVFVPQVPRHLVSGSDKSERTRKEVRELLRALGGCLVAIGLSLGILVSTTGRECNSTLMWLVLTLVLPAEGTNAFCMWRVGAPFFIPLLFVVLALIGAGLALWPNH
ncbi:MAG: hypothetical protein JO182_31145 [Acidobacteriaceae bacterium]|nr:hypothetical protein [Acidobacteriaceae bacterium]